MTAIRRAIVAGVVAWLMAPTAAHAQDRVGQVFIEGNTATPDSVIIAQFNLRPGQLLDLPSLKLAQQRLAKSGLFAADTPPVVEAIPNELDATFKSVRIRVTERAGTWAFFALVDGVTAFAKLDVEGMGTVARTVQKKMRGK